MECLKSCWQCISTCFCRKSESEKGLLFTHQDPGGMGHLYTVRRISSFGRDILNKDDDTEDIIFDANETPEKNINSLTVPWSSKAVPIQTQITEEKWENCEETFPKMDNKKLASPGSKQKGRWTKALGKVRKREFVKSKQGTNNESKHVEIGKRLSEISLEESTQSVKTDTSQLSCKEPTITVSTPDLLKHRSPASSNKCLAASSSDLRSMGGDMSTLSVSANSWLKSQSMQDVKSVSEVEESIIDREQEREKLAKAHGLDLSLYTNSTQSKSSEAIYQSAWKSPDVFGKDDVLQDIPLGTIEFSVQYDISAKKLEVHVDKLKLCGKGRNGEAYNAILKLTILPENKHQKISNALPRSLEPIANLKFKFSVSDITGKFLRISVYDEEWQGIYDAVGHVLFDLEEVHKHTSKIHQQMKLYKQSTSDVIPGSLQVSLGYQEDRKTLSIIIVEACNLTFKQPKGKGKFKTCIKIIYYSNGKVVKEKQSPLVNNDIVTSYNYSVNFKIDASGINNSYIVIKVKERHLLQDRTIGRLILGPYFYCEGNLNFTPWGRAILKREIVSHCFRLHL